jgi:solute carrier family 13 (sodium-dependent dicarboxylate transporter), member 2/3/5
MDFKTLVKEGEIIRKIIFLAAPVLFLYIVFFVDLAPGKPTITYTFAVAVLMALWWITEVVPLAITSILPVVLFPLLGVMDGKTVSTTYFNYIIFLFLGGFLVALAMEKWNLHKRIALKILLSIGVSPGRILLGFMLGTAFLSMWISNTATTMLMIPILISVILKLEEINSKESVRHFSIGLLLSIAYSASIGGIATLIGTPPNLLFVRIYKINFPNAPDITFANWFFYAFPMAILLLIVTWAYLYFVFVKSGKNFKHLDHSVILDEYKALGKWTYEQKILGVLFIVLGLLWFFRADIVLGSFTIPGWSNIFNHPVYFNDGTIAIAIATLLFLIPSKQKKGTYLMDWKASENIPWEILLLFGGGFALASGFKTSGLSLWIGNELIWIKDISPFVVIMIIAAVVTFLTEITSNTATASTFLPVLAGMALSANVNPLLFMLPATISASLAFMLPVATAPNAIIFGTKRLRIVDMSKTGLFLNFLGIFIVTVITYYLGAWVFGI